MPSVWLHEPRPGDKSFYVTLSHRWAGDIFSKTTKAKVLSYMKNIPYDSLPATFQDAVLTTLKIGMRFLWIDALSIIQDDPKDWKDHAPLMGDIFRKSISTLAAHSAADTNHEYLSSTEGSEVVSLRVPHLQSLPKESPVCLGLTR